MSKHDLEKVVNTFITSRLDYYNTLLTGLSQKEIGQLHLIKIAAARVVERTKKSLAYNSSSQVTTLFATLLDNQHQNTIACP